MDNSQKPDFLADVLSKVGKGAGPSGVSRKRTFVPNIPLRRTKGKKADLKGEESSSEGKRCEGKGGLRNPKQKGRIQYVQTQGGIFSEGVEASKIKRCGGESYRGSSGAKSEQPIRVKKEFIKGELVGDEKKWLEEDDEDKESFDGEEDLEEIISLPTISHDNPRKISIFPEEIEQTSSQTKTIPTTVKIKSEPRDDGFDSPMDSYGGLGDRQSSGAEPLYIIQLPECLPFEKSLVEEDPNNSLSPRALNESELYGVTLDQLEEGYIGKIQLLKSGRTKLVMGPVEYIMDVLEDSFMQDIVYLEGNELMILGKQKKTLNCFQNILD